MAARPNLAVGLRRPDGIEVQVYHQGTEICAVVPAAALDDALGAGAPEPSVRAWLTDNAAGLTRAAIARSQGHAAAAPFDGLRILGVASCR
jgi:hypothetical protein